ncbi:unnamed protein product [Rhizophagus irregularis]|uniref:Uncharacterized protein n=1 Tax=Rhizophagus irregularis TaxID=588596 RepID=A0A915ZQS3_9GLOM|nr:unnamed protein product [Rhizophagus irregularis]CAB5383673.1 unnamed protein product [Rhizophagus irregularis]
MSHPLFFTSIRNLCKSLSNILTPVRRNSYSSLTNKIVKKSFFFQLPLGSASYTFQEEIGIALVEDKSGFAGIIEIVKLHGNDGQDYIFTYCLFEDVSS